MRRQERPHWSAHWGQALAARLGYLALPAAIGATGGYAADAALRPVVASTTIALGIGMVVAILVAIITARALRPLLPLAMLLRLSLVFPDRAPSRFRIALRVGNPKRAEAWAARSLCTTQSTTASEQAAQLLTLCAALNVHDRRTRGHSERVRALTELVAEELGLPEPERVSLRWGALLHDIGKLHVDRDVLNKQAPLTDREWEEVHHHPVEGRRLVAPLSSWLGDGARAIDQHHERYDGLGYPQGVRGDEISLAGRIVSVTDAFDTMAAVRAYKPAMDVKEARAELVRCAGSHFDPAVVRAFLGISVGRLRWTIGAAAFLAPVSLLPGMPRLGAGWARLAGVGSASLQGAVAAVVLTGGLSLPGLGGESTPSPAAPAVAPMHVVADQPHGRDALGNDPDDEDPRTREGDGARSDEQADIARLAALINQILAPVVADESGPLAPVLQPVLDELEPIIDPISGSLPALPGLG